MVWSMCPVDLDARPMRVSSRFDEFLRHLDLYHELLGRFDGDFSLISSARDLDDKFLANDRIGIILHIERQILFENLYRFFRSTL